MEINKLTNEELNNKLKEMKTQLEEFCESEDYYWYLKYKDYTKNHFDKYSDWKKCLSKRTKISARLSYLRANIDSIEYELHIRYTNGVSLNREKGGFYEATGDLYC